MTAEIDGIPRLVRHVSLSDEEIALALRPFSFEATAEFCGKVREYVALLSRWNERVSLTTIRSIGDILRLHFGESLFAIAAAGIENGRLADYGSGAGFPGVPLAMARPALQVTLIEANGKKAAFLSELKRQLGLHSLAVHHGRAAEVKATEIFDIVSARAVGDYSALLNWSGEHLRDSGRVLLWLGGKDAHKLTGTPGWTWGAPVVIPNSRGRFLLVGVRK